MCVYVCVCVNAAPWMCEREAQVSGKMRGRAAGARGVRGVMACYRGCIKAVYVREEV